jgi:hypothetical protein
MALLWVEVDQPCYMPHSYVSNCMIYKYTLNAGSTVMYTAHCIVYTSVFWFHIVNTIINMKATLSWARGTIMHTEHSTSSMFALTRFFTSSMSALIWFL